MHGRATRGIGERVNRLGSVRRFPAALAALSFTALALTGCATSSFSTDACVRPASDDTVADFAIVTGAVGDAPQVEVAAPIRVSETAFADIITGDGARMHAGHQLARIEMTLFEGATGEQVAATQYDAATSMLTSAEYWAKGSPGLAAALECASAGTRSVVALTPEDVAQLIGPSVGTVVAVVDVVSVQLARAEGTRIFNDGRGLPSVVRAPDGRPGIVVPRTTAPTDLVAQVLIEGSGDKITADTPFYAHYTGVTWSDGEVFDSSWGGQATQFTLGGLVEGVAEALEGQTVGSQVMVVVPPELGYGDESRPGIAPGSTLVFVFDILAIDAATATAQ